MGEYGFLTMGHYKYVMRILGDYEITQDTTIWIISQLTQKSLRKGEQSNSANCKYLIEYLVDNAFKSIFEPGNVQIVYDSDENDDYYRMVNAPLLFCSPSSFCSNAGFANVNAKTVVIPGVGPWIDFKKVFDDGTDNDDFVIAQNSKLLPSNVLIIDTEKSGFHCNKIDNYNEARYDVAKYTKKL